MQILAEYRPHKGTNNRQQYILSVYIFCHFQIIKSKHFNRCQFPASFCNINIIQINFSYGLKKDKLFSRYYIQDEDGNKYVSNFLIIELNMDKYMEFLYNKDEEEINKYIEHIMLDLGEKDNMMIENSIRLERD